MQYIISYISALGAFVALDLLWLGVIAKGFYACALKDLIADPVRVAPAILFYVLFAVGLVIFVIEPALAKNSFTHALLYGALFGFFVYMTYELTNASIIRDWPSVLIPVDIIWGTVLGAGVSAFAFWVTKFFT